MQAQKKHKSIIDKQIHIIGNQSSKFMVEQTKFKDKRDKILEEYYRQKV